MAAIVIDEDALRDILDEKLADLLADPDEVVEAVEDLLDQIKEAEAP